MKKTIVSSLSYIEEFIASMFFCNVEKFKYLVSIDCFKQSILTNFQKIGERELRPYTITAGYRKMLGNLECYHKLNLRNEEIAKVLEEDFGISLDDDIDFRTDGDIPLFTVDSSLRMQKPEMKMDFDLCDAIGRLDIKRTRQLLDEGANPLTSYKDKSLNALSELISRTKLSRGYYDPGIESWETMQFSLVNLFPHYVMREQMVTLVSQYVSEEDIRQSEVDVARKWEAIKESHKHKTVSLPENIKVFLDSIDCPNAILAIMDEDKCFHRYDYARYYSKILEYVMTSLKHVKVRVGGNSYRVAKHLLAQMKENNYPKGRFEYLNCDDDDELYGENVEIINMQRYDFNSNPAFVSYASEFDIRGFSDNGERRSMVWYYVNNIDTGFYKEDGAFCSFDSNIKGLWALTEVALVKGYEDIEPSTACIFANSRLAYSGFRTDAGASAGYKMTLQEKQERLCIEQSIPYLDLAVETHLK